MVLDYHERKAALRDRRGVGKNRPKKRPAGFFVLIVLAVIIVSYAGGVVTGWFVFRPVPQPMMQAAPSQEQNQGAKSSVDIGKSAIPASSHDPALTFYETLSKGNQSLIGSGINPKKSTDDTGKHTSPPVHSVSTDQAKTSSTAARSPGESKTGNSAASEPSAASTTQGEEAAKGGAATFAVQIASYRDRKEAEAAVSRIASKGFAAYVLESKAGDKGVWYRVRLGRNLSHQAAVDLAQKAGKGAVAVTEK